MEMAPARVLHPQQPGFTGKPDQARGKIFRLLLFASTFLPFKFPEQLLEFRQIPDRPQVIIIAHPPRIRVAQLHCLLQGRTCIHPVIEKSKAAA